MLNARETADVGSPRYSRAGSVKEGLVQEEDEEPADAGENGADPETPAPGGPRHDERGDERPQVRAQDNGELYIVDDSWVLVEEKQILDPHQGSSLAHATEEAINDAGSEVGVKTGGCRRPDAGADHNALEEQRDRPAPKETGESDDKEAARSDSEEVADNRALHSGLRQMPLAVMTRPLVASPLHNRERCMNVGLTYIDCGMTVIMAVPPV